jgi:hypothetical protein
VIRRTVLLSMWNARRTAQKYNPQITQISLRQGSGVTPSRETVSHLHTWLIKDFAIQSNHGSPELRSTGEAEVSSAGEQLTEE